MKRPKPYDLTTHDGKTVDWLTKAALLKAERIIGSYTLSITQGSYNAGRVSASAGTHDGGGVVDLREWDWPNKVRALRLAGFVAWHRPELWRGGKRIWPGHIHAVLMDNKRLSSGAQSQINAYHHGLDGLAAAGPDPHKGMVFRGFSWPYAGPVGLARWHRDQLTGRKRKNYLTRLRRVVRGN